MKTTTSVLSICLSVLAISQAAHAGARSQKLEFTDKCSAGAEITVSAVGDVLLHAPLQKQAFSVQGQYRSLWPAMIPIFKSFNVSYANFEGPSAEGLSSGGNVNNNLGFNYDANVYSSYPMFNYHPNLVKDLVQSGIDVVSTANNHALDRRSKGADMTTDAMRQYGLPYTGTKPAGAQNQGWHAITETNGIRIAWLACTFSTNGLTDTKEQVLMCYQNRNEVLNYVYALSQDRSINAVIVTPHWGEEYSHSPAKKEMEFARQLIDAGALAVLGTHPHVIQPWEKYTSPRSGKEGLIVYSTGNFVSGQFQRVPTQVGLMIGVKMVQDRQSQQLKIKAARYMPLLMKRTPYRVEPVLDDGSASPQFSSIWNNMYPSENRITDLANVFPEECR